MPAERISRRTLLYGTAGAGAGLVLPRGVLARPEKEEELRWALVADTHINGSPEVGVVRDILSRTAPHAMIFAGDLAHRDGQREAYTRLLGLAYPLCEAGMHVHWLLGNHDNREHFLDAAFANCKPELTVRDHYARIVQRAGVRWFLLDSLIRPNHTPGALGEAQMAWLRRELDADQRTPAIVVLHHNVDEQGGQLAEGKAFFDLVCSTPQVKAVFQGHNHVYEMREVEGFIS